MASYSNIQHRFANKLSGKNGCIKAGNVRYEGRNYYSYSTVFGQWADIEKNVCIGVRCVYVQIGREPNTHWLTESGRTYMLWK